MWNPYTKNLLRSHVGISEEEDKFVHSKDQTLGYYSTRPGYQANLYCEHENRVQWVEAVMEGQYIEKYPKYFWG